ncbi:MAG TPA: hypothetical protein VGG34_10365 [Opitutaceae bacterium]
MAFGVWNRLASCPEAFIGWGKPRLPKARGAIATVLFCTALVVAVDGRGFVHGFFRQDDFSFLAVARSPKGLGEQMHLYHNDHLYPLYRLEVWALVRVAGAAATVRELSIVFNLANFLSCTGLLIAGCWMLHEIGASRMVAFLAALMIWMWPGWGEFTAGYYTLSAYVQVQALTFCAAASMLRGFRKGSNGWLASSLLLVTAAIGMNISGASSFACLFAIATAVLLGRPERRKKLYLVLLAAVFVAVCGLYLGVLKHAYSPRELVQNPTGQPAGPEMIQFALHHPIAVARTAVSAPGGLIMNGLTPTFLQILSDRGSLAPALRRSLVLMELLVAIAAAIYVGWRLSRVPAQKRFLIVAMAACAGISLALVVVARTSYAISTPATLWYPKYMLMPVCWLWMAIALFADSAYFSVPGYLRAPGVLYAGAALGIWLTASYALWERTLIPGSVAYAPRGRWGNVENSLERRAHYEAVIGDLKAIAAAAGSSTVCLPDQALWRSDFYDQHSVLEWGSDWTPKGVTYLFWDLLAADPGVGIKGRWVSEAEMTPRLHAALSSCPWIGPGLRRASAQRTR